MVSSRLAVLVLSVVSIAALPAVQTSAPDAAVAPENPPDVVARLQAHYRAALAELSAADVSHLDSARRASRAAALTELSAYCERGVFGIGRNPACEREPNFVDGGGRLCAVANLMAASGERALVEEVAASANHAYVVELASNPALVEWLDRHGFTIQEAARIQAPSSHKAPPEPAPSFGFSPPLMPGGPGPSGNPWGAGSRPGTTTGAPVSHVASGVGSAGAVGSGGVTSRGAVRGGPLTTGAAWTPDGGEDDWWLWWEMNKLRFLKPHRLALSESGTGAITRGFDASAGGPVDTFGTHVGSSLASQVRAELLPVLLTLVHDEDAVLRARAAVTLGRLGGKEAVEPLTALLSDSQMVVRHAAILGLGATGAMEAAPTLLHLAQDGTLPGGDGHQLSSWARPLAFVALGLGRRHGMSPVLDGFVADLAQSAAQERSELGTAALLYQTLSPCDDLARLARDLVADEDADPALRCRATETLGQAGDAAELPSLTHLLGDGQLEVRRSAALALCGLRHSLAVPALETAYELEEEPVARGFLLLAVAEQGGDGAREFLVKAARGGPQAARPWAALGLGLLARSLDEPGDAVQQKARAAICTTLREGLSTEANHSAIGAWMLAAGIARDTQIVPPLRDAMIRSKDQRLRMFAALSLAMIGDTESRPLMLEQLELEQAPLAIIGLTQALGAFGVAEDGPALVEAVHEMRAPSTQALLAVALAFHGSESAVTGLMAVARDETASSAARAAAVDGLGLLLDRQPGLMLQEVAADSNFSVFPDWVNGMLTGFTL
jgi:HEAT repeat protein